MTPMMTTLRRPSRAPLFIAAVTIVVAVAAGYFWMKRAAPAPPSVVTHPPEVVTTTRAIDPPTIEDNVVGSPPTSPESVSSHATFHRWLAETEVYSRFVAAMLRVADGESPAPLLQFLRPSGAFQVEERNGELVIAAASFARYDPLVDVIDTIDPVKAAAAYRTMKPMLGRMHSQIAPPKASLDGTVARALSHLLSTPTPPREIVVVPSEGINYAYADTKLERQSAAQKHLTRMGTRNAERVKKKLRALQSHL